MASSITEEAGNAKLKSWVNSWSNMSIEKQFETAVDIIKKLPKDGPYQPSNQMMLKFYGYYKQATEGPCNDPKPSFWDVIRRAKWDAWHKLGDMEKHEAMEHYVHDLKLIIETMSFSAEVADFMDTLGPFYESVEDNESNQEGDSGIELEQGNVNALIGNFDEAYMQQQSMQMKASNLESRLDRMMQDMDNVQKIISLANDDDHEEINDDESSSNDHYEDPANDFNENSVSAVEEALNKAVHQLNSDLNLLKDRVSNLESAALAAPKPQSPLKKSGFLSELSGQTTAFVIIWPFAAFALLKLCNK